ncbi:MAG: AAA family ATPase [Candidatus Zixiibacteriota bacterium]|nr:MAG: AAA family ATPase [candidate division Zixibacteria bacterium]
MNLIFVHGMPGVGKLTVARELSRLIGYKLFHNHLTVDLVESVFEFGTQTFVELRESIWLSVFEKAMDSGLPGLIFTFAFEPTVTACFVPATVEMIESRGGNIFFVELRCDPDILEGRLTDPSRAAYRKLTSVSKLRELVAQDALATPPLPRRNLVVDITELSPEKAARWICTRVGIKTREADQQADSARMG